jgi:dTDP-4-dehydrorhamnose reductase
MPDLTKVLVLGASGRLGRALVRRYRAAGLAVSSLSHNDLDLARPDEFTSTLDRHDFNVLINTAGLTDVDYCEAHEGLATVVNGTAPGALAAHCQQRGARLVQISTDYVFSGEGRAPFSEDSPVSPINVYGRTKLDGERNAQAAQPDALILRVSWLFGLEKPSFPDRIIRQAQERLDVSAVDDKWACPTYSDDVCDWLLALLPSDHASGVFHLCNQGTCSWQQYGERTLTIASQLGLPLKTTSIRGHTMEGFAPFLAQRPPFTALSTEKFTRTTGITPRSWEDALEDYLRAKYLTRI